MPRPLPIPLLQLAVLLMTAWLSATQACPMRPPRLPYPRIARDGSISGGQPVVAGTRIPVATIVRSQQLGMDFDQILVQYPGLAAADLHAAMLYYLDHHAEIDALLAQATEPVEGAVIVR